MRVSVWLFSLVSTLDPSQISVNSEVVAVTGQGGRYYIPGIRPGTVTIIATSTTMKFSALAGVEVRSLVSESARLDACCHSCVCCSQVTPSSSVLPDIVAVSYSLCGAVLLGGFPGRTSLTHTIQLSQLGLPSTGLDLQTSTDEEGSYCFFVPPGRYQLTALVPEDEAAAGLVLTPSPLFAIVEKVGAHTEYCVCVRVSAANMLSLSGAHPQRGLQSNIAHCARARFLLLEPMPFGPSCCCRERQHGEAGVVGGCCAQQQVSCVSGCAEV